MAESHNIEWKESWRDEYLKWICVFANAQGGKIYIGTKDDGTVIGLKTARGLLKRAGALCFYRTPEKVIGGCYVKIGKFAGSELLYQDEVHGSLLIMADRVIDLIYLKYLKAAISYL